MKRYMCITFGVQFYICDVGYYFRPFAIGQFSLYNIYNTGHAPYNIPDIKIY